MNVDIEWSGFAAVTAAVLVTSVLLAVGYAGGIRLLEAEGRTSVAARVGAYACFAVCAAAVLFGLWLVIPQFHAS